MITYDHHLKLTRIVELMTSLVIRIVVESLLEIVAITSFSWLQTGVLLLSDLLLQLISSLLILLFNDLVLLP